MHLLSTWTSVKKWRVNTWLVSKVNKRMIKGCILESPIQTVPDITKKTSGVKSHIGAKNVETCLTSKLLIVQPHHELKLFCSENHTEQNKTLTSIGGSHSQPNAKTAPYNASCAHYQVCKLSRIVQESPECSPKQVTKIISWIKL